MDALRIERRPYAVRSTHLYFFDPSNAAEDPDSVRLSRAQAANISGHDRCATDATVGEGGVCGAIGGRDG